METEKKIIKRINEQVKWDEDLFKQYGLTIIEQNLTDEQWPIYGYGYYKGKSELLGKMIVLGFIFIILLFLLVTTIIFGS